MIAVRPLAPGDCETAVALLAAQLQEHEIAVARADLHTVTQAIAAEPRHGFILLASLGDNNAVGLGYAAAHLSAEHGGIIGWLEELYVRPDARGRGVGAALLEAVSARAAALGWRGLELEVVQGHERAVPLYLRHGFLPTERARFTRLFPGAN